MNPGYIDNRRRDRSRTRWDDVSRRRICNEERRPDSPDFEDVTPSETDFEDSPDSDPEQDQRKYRRAKFISEKEDCPLHRNSPQTTPTATEWIRGKDPGLNDLLVFCNFKTHTDCLIMTIYPTFGQVTLRRPCRHERGKEEGNPFHPIPLKNPTATDRKLGLKQFIYFLDNTARKAVDFRCQRPRVERIIDALIKELVQENDPTTFPQATYERIQLIRDRERQIAPDPKIVDDPTNSLVFRSMIDENIDPNIFISKFPGDEEEEGFYWHFFMTESQKGEFRRIHNKKAAPAICSSPQPHTSRDPDYIPRQPTSSKVPKNRPEIPIQVPFQEISKYQASDAISDIRILNNLIFGEHLRLARMHYRYVPPPPQFQTGMDAINFIAKSNMQIHSHAAETSRMKWRRRPRTESEDDQRQRGHR